MKGTFRDEIFDGVSFLAQAEYENCSFRNLRFSEFDFSEYQFSSCTFLNCDFSLSKWNKTALRNILFSDCKMIGSNFENLNAFGLKLEFVSSLLDQSVFYQLDIPATIFRNCRLLEVDFSEANLSGSDFEDSDLSGAIFENTQLEKADFSSARYFYIDPERNKIKGAKFSVQGLSGLLGKYGIDVV